MRLTKFRMAALAAAALCAVAVRAEMKGSSANAADPLTVSTKDTAPRSFSMTPEYDPDTGTYWTVVTNVVEGETVVETVTNFVYYFKMTCSRGKAYTVWLENQSSDEIIIDSIEPRELTEAEEESDADIFEPSAYFEEISGNWGLMWYMAPDTWSTDADDLDPASWAYIIKIAGSAGDTATIHYVQANALPEGIEENPVKIASISEGEAGQWTASYQYVTNEFSFCFAADMKVGRRYVFQSDGASAGNTNILSFGTGKTTPYAPWKMEDNEDSKSYDPDADELTIIKVSGISTNHPSDKVKVRYRLIPERSLGQHNPKPITVDGAGVSVSPGRINAMGNAYYDRIIDNNLFSFTAVKGGRYVASTEGAVSNVLIRVYDSKGAIIGESHRSGDGTPDARCGFTASSAGTFYVGVAQNLEDDDLDEVFPQTVKFTVETVKPKAGDPDEWDYADDDIAGASLLAPVASRDWGTDTPYDVDKDGHGWHRLGRHDWYDTFAICARAGLTYTVATTLVSGEVTPTTSLTASAFYMNGNSEISVRSVGDINPDTVNPFKTPFRFTAAQNAVYYIRIRVKEGDALDYPEYKVHVMASDQGYPWDGIGYGLDLATVKVRAKGNPGAAWMLNSEKVSYPNGATIVLPLQSYDAKTKKYTALSYTVKFPTLKGFSNPSDVKASLTKWKTTEITTAYTDTFDPKDDQASGKGTVGGKSVTYGATTWAVKAAATTNARTFWAEDPADNFAITGKDGTYFDFSLSQQSESDDEDDEPDAVFSIKNGSETFCENVTEISKLHLPASKSKYILAVTHRNPSAPVDTSYSITGFSADVGAIKFAKNAVSVKENAASVVLTVNRTAKNGRVVVDYTTVDGTAKAGEKYYAQSGTLVWENGDNKAKTITIKLIPDIVGYYHAGDRSFYVRLSDAGDSETAGEYPAKFPSGDTATVTLANSQTKAANNTVASAYKEIKTKSVKTEQTYLRAGTFFGVAEAAEGLMNGFPRLASVSVTVASKNGSDSLSAKVQLAGKSYAFKSDSKTPLEWEDLGDGRKSVTVSASQKIGSATYENTMTLTVADGATEAAGLWKASGGEVALEMHVPDAEGSGFQGPVAYAGKVFRDNSKIDGFLKAAVNFTGYYTVALAPFSKADGSAAGPGNLPSGNGYLTITVDNGGKTKGAGMLADGTKVSLAAAAAGILEDSGSATGYAMYVPVYAAKSPYCFGGLLKFTATDADNGDGRKTVVVDGAASSLAWFSDNTALSASGADALAYELKPVGGFYDTVERLQRHYFDRGYGSFAVDTVGVDELPNALFTVGGVTYSQRVATQEADGFNVDLAVDAFSTGKKTLVKGADKRTDYAASVNPANVQVKAARATGLVTGSFSVWAETATGAQKEITGAKHYGVLLMSAGEIPEGATIDETTVSAGFFNIPVSVTTGGRARKWTYAAPFNIKAKEEE